MHWLLRAKRWVQHPPSPTRVKIVFGILVVCLCLFGLERAGLLPDWMQAERLPRR